MLTVRSISSQMVYNGVTEQTYQTKGLNLQSQRDEEIISSTPKASFLNRFNSFVKNKSQTANCDVQKKLKNLDFSNVLLLQHFWNDKIKTKKSNESFIAVGQVYDSCFESTSEHHFNKHKNAEFVRYKKRKLTVIALFEH